MGNAQNQSITEKICSATFWHFFCLEEESKKTAKKTSHETDCHFFCLEKESKKTANPAPL